MRLFFIVVPILVCSLTTTMNAQSIRCPQPMLSTLFRTIEPNHRDFSTSPTALVQAERPNLGSTRAFWLWDFTIMPPGFKQVEATCVRVTTNAYVFVETSHIGSTLDQAAIDEIARTFEEACPADPNRGIYQVDVDCFGEPPDSLDSDPRIYLLYASLPEYGPQAFDGYFNAFDQMPDELAWANYRQHSNEVELLYLNVTGSYAANSEYMLSVLAHEFQHLIHYRYDTEEETWVNEAMSEAAMTKCGYFTDKAHLAHYCSKPAIPLIDTEHPSYGAVLLFGTYLFEQGGEALLRAVVESTKVGTFGIEDALHKSEIAGDFPELFHRWTAANFATGWKTLESREKPDSISEFSLGYRSFPIPSMKLIASLDAQGGQFEAKLGPSGVGYLMIKSPQNAMSMVIEARPELPCVHYLTKGVNGAPSLLRLAQNEADHFTVPAGEGVVIFSRLDGGSKFRGRLVP